MLVELLKAGRVPPETPILRVVASEMQQRIGWSNDVKWVLFE